MDWHFPHRPDMLQYMMLSRLQKYILMTCLAKGGRASREVFYGYYTDAKNPSTHDDQVNSVTKALERLIDRELMVGYGVRTPHKWYIKEAKLSPRGRRIAKRLLGEQQLLPLISKRGSRSL